MTIGENIAKMRKEKGWTQAELGEKLGVSNQAVSKWESGMTFPDVMLLPTIADVFECYIDHLFSREIKEEIHYDLCTELPWEDDHVIRGVVCEGRKILQCDPINKKFTFEIKGDAKNVRSECNIEVNGCVSGGCNAGGHVNIAAGLSGGCNAGGAITVGANLSGGCNTGGSITCGGNLSGDISCGGKVLVSGNVEAVRIKGNVNCHSLKCDKIIGMAKIG